MESGVYQIWSRSFPDRSYIGSSFYLSIRQRDHLGLLRRNQHHSIKLQHHYNKYGEDDLVFEIIENGDYFNEQHLLSREQGWYWHFHYKNNEIPYFNICGIAGSRKGHNPSLETRHKMSLSRIGNSNSKGHKITEETRNKLKVASVNRSPEYRIKLSIAGKGRKHSEETKQKIREANLGRTFSAETIEKMRKAAMGNKKSVGHKHTEESKRKMSETRRRNILKRKEQHG